MAASLVSDVKVDIPPVVEEIELNSATIATVDDDTPIIRPIGLALENAEGRPAAVRKRFEIVGFIAILFFMFTLGWNDGTQGPLLPAIQAHYHVGFTVVSIIFVCYCSGFLFGSFLNVYLSNALGFGRIVVIGATLQMIAYSLQSPAPPFPLFCMAYCFSGFGISLQLSQTMVYVLRLPDSSLKMSIYQMTYGIGALVSPLSSTHFAAVPRWSFHFLISLGLSLVNIMSLVLVFRFRRLKDILGNEGPIHVTQTSGAQINNENQYLRILKLKIVHIFALFLFAYVGVEVTIGGWIVTFVEQKRGGGHSSGLALGRILFIWLNRKVGERRVIWLYLVLAIGLEVTVWVTPSLIQNAVATSLIGLLLGPIYPIVMNMSGRLIPHSVLSGAVGWISGFAQTGSAVLPFITGTMSSKFGVASLQPL
ncbi:MFS general substrate transporter [Schizopora paradoxa]|uniref:MFS general substrate transporter n=1 Tax=Schizopora paradoxa TaxID=27342 RepID=A0A0H2RC22_9AGAM|nr:MFS general substrate transporter [Schizopora paradoxa]